jgi:FixJ family two-component response regulator
LESVLEATGRTNAADTTPGRPTVRVIDDDWETRELLRGLAESVDFEVETYVDAAKFLKELDPSLPGCLVLDARLHGLSGLQLQQELAARNVGLPVIVTTRHGDVATAVAAMRAGAFDVVEKPILSHFLLASIRRAVAADLSRRTSSAEAAEIRLRYGRLTGRERDVLRLVAAGMTSRSIAAHLGVCERTVEVYRSRIKHKMQARNSADLARMMYDVSPPAPLPGALVPGRERSIPS